MQHAVDVIEALGQTNSRLDKEQIVQAAFDAGCSEFFEGARMALDVLITYGAKQIPESVCESGTITWNQFKLLAEQLAARKLTGNAAKAAIAFTANNTDARTWNTWYRRILLQDLKCGTSEKTINSVLARNGKVGKAWEVPVFSCQLAKPADDHPKKMVGEKFVDRKYDGCLSSEWIIEFEDGRKITIGEVVSNKVQGRIKSYNVNTKQIEFNEIEAWATNRDMTDEPVKWFKLSLENGITLPPLTGNHLVWLPKIQCWRRVDQLKTGDELLQDIV